MFCDLNYTSAYFCAILDDETLRFIQNHPFMQEAVQPLTSSPLFTITESKTALSAIAVETNPQQNDTVVVYAGKLASRK